MWFVDDVKRDRGTGWYRRHTAVVGILALSTSVCVGIAAAGGLSILHADEEAKTVWQPPEHTVPPPVIVPVDPVPLPALNKAPRAPAPPPPPPPPVDEFGTVPVPPSGGEAGNRLRLVKEERESTVGEQSPHPWGPPSGRDESGVDDAGRDDSADSD
ncbi:MAG: hypothetical protein ACRD0P_29010 [Stackebrandtia sp.]